MGKRINGLFLSAYSELDEYLCGYYGIDREGITEYVNRLGAIRKAPKKEVVISHLVKYRRLKCSLDGGTPFRDKIRAADISWLIGFRRDLENKRDPIALSERKTERRADIFRHKLLKLVLPIVAGVLVAVAVIILVTMLVGR